MSAPNEPATERQVAFLRTLLAEREIPPTHSARTDGEPLSGRARRQVALSMLNNGEFTEGQASMTIEWLLSLPKIEQES